MILDLGFCLILFFGVSFGLAWPLACRLSLDPVEKVGACAALSLLIIFLLGWIVYVWALPLKLFWILPVLAVAGATSEWRTINSTARDGDVRALLAAQVLVTAWSIGLLAVTLTYSGGAWVADWWGHLQRTSFFLDRGPRDILFNGFDALTSRPPLANIVTGVFVQITRRDFVHYQVFSTLFASLTFLPAGLLARRFGGNVAVPVLTLLFIANPMFAENATYSWTKLPAAFFTLTALYFFLRANEQVVSHAATLVFAVALAAALLTHYSAGPYAVILGLGWFGLGWDRRKEPAWHRATCFAVLAGALVLATWFGWCFSVYGVRGTLMTNTSITDKAPDSMTQMRTVILNITDTLVPHFLRDVDLRQIEQRSSVGKWRDWFFQLYQVNFIFAFGSTASFVIAFKLVKSALRAPPARSIFWTVFIVGNILLGVAVHGGREAWGLAHICLQPLVFLGLAFLAAQWSQLTRFWRLALIIGATVDLAAGIGLQFLVQSFAFERWFSPERSVLEIIADYSQAAQMNFRAKMFNHWAFLGDLLIDYGYAITGFLAVVTLVALRLANSPRNIPAGSRES